MSDNTRINAGVGGDNIATEDIGPYKIPVVKVRIGSLDTDGGDITAANPLPAQLSQAGATLTAANPIPIQISQGNALITNLNPIPIKISDGSNQVGTTQGRNSDNQIPSNAAFQLDVSGPTAILNPCSNSNGVNAGGYDRQRSTAFDGQPAAGITSGSNQFAIPFTTTLNNSAITGGNSAQVITVTSATNLKVNDYVAVGGANPENIFINAVSGSTITAVFKANHTGSETLNWFHYNVARDAGAGNDIPLTGLSASMTYLYNQNSGQAQIERSAGGELDGASGDGTALAAEYEWNGNPLANGSVLSGSQFDRARNLNAKGKGSGTISNNPLAANSTTLTLNSGPTTLIPGQKVLLDRAGINPETNYVGASYVAGSTTVPLQIATQFSHAQNATVEWDQHAPLGPGLNGFLPDGIGIEEEALWDPVSQQFYIERAATQDAVSGQNIVAEACMVWNGTTFDRLKEADADGYSAVGVPFESLALWDGYFFDRFRSQSSVNTGNMQIPSPMPGIAMVSAPAGWSRINAPTAAAQATVTLAAGGGGVRHVCTSITVSVSAGSTAQTPLNVYLRDGASGTGTIIWAGTLAAAANSAGVIALAGLAISGSPATSMTLEFSGTGVSNALQAVTMTGYDIS